MYSDIFVSSLTRDPEMITRIQHLKGWFYVLATAVLLFFFTKRHLTRLRKAEARAKENDQLKTTFVQNISHELRTPMNSIIGFSELVQLEKTENEFVNSYLDNILNSSKQLLVTINDVLDTSMLESGVMKLHLSEIKLKGFLKSFYSAYSPMMNAEVRLQVVADAVLDNYVFLSDEDKLRRVIGNLLNNAIKFTHSGIIELGCRNTEEGLLFHVKDTGVGICDELHTVIFERFRQAPATVDNCVGGTGLGLSICKEIVELFGGRIWVESEVDRGSVFRFTVPLLKDDVKANYGFTKAMKN